MLKSNENAKKKRGNKMKRVLSIICSLIMLLSAGMMCACGGDEEEYLLTIGYDNGGYGLTWLENAVEKFCAKEGISPDQVYIEAEKDYTSSVNDKLVNNTSIRDVLLISANAGTAREWAALGLLEPLDDVFNTTLTTGTTAGKTVMQALKDKKRAEAGRYNDNYYCFPTDGGAWGIFYNKTMFEENGWEVPETYDQLVALCEKIYQDNKNVADNDKIHPFVCSSDITQYWDFIVQNWVVQLIGIEKYNEFCDLSGPEIYAENSVYGQAKIKALNAWSDIAVKNGEKYVVADSASFLAAQILFANGKIAMMPNGSWFENEIKASLPDDVEIALMPTPYIDGALKDADGNYKKVSYGGNAGGYVIPAAATHKDLAKKFLAFLAEEETIKQVTLDSGSFSPFACDYTDVVEDLTVCQKSVYDTINGADSFGFISTSPIAAAGMGIGFWIKGMPYASMLSGSTTARAFVAGEETYANAEWEKILERIEI